MSDPSTSAFIDGNLCRVPTPFDVERDRLIAEIDSHPEISGAGIILIRDNGNKVEVRGGPRLKWVWIAPKGMITEPTYQASDESPPPIGFWDRWGNSVLSCGSAVATGVVIGMSGGTATPLVGAFAVNSALLCGTSLGKAIAYDAWKEFEDEGGTGYKIWLTTETLLSLIDLLNGAKGAATLLKNWKNAGKLVKLQKAVRGKNLSRAQLHRIIQEIDAVEASKIALKAKGANYASKAKILGISEKLVKDAQFISLSNQRRRLIVDGIGNALSLGGSPDNAKGLRQTYVTVIRPAIPQNIPQKIRKQWDVWLVGYANAGTPQ